MRLKHDVVWGRSRQQKCVPGMKKSITVCIILIRIDIILSKYLKWLSKFVFQEVAGPVRQPNTFFGNFTHPQTHFGCPKTVGRVLGYTTEPTSVNNLLISLCIDGSKTLIICSSLSFDYEKVSRIKFMHGWQLSFKSLVFLSLFFSVNLCR